MKALDTIYVTVRLRGAKRLERRLRRLARALERVQEASDITLSIKGE